VNGTPSKVMNVDYYGAQPVSLSEMITVRIIMIAVHVLFHEWLANYGQCSQFMRTKTTFTYENH
jgi:hypothetical protein